MNLRIVNFQAIKEINLDLTGFVVIKGKSNSGKSSIRRAINSLFFNNWNKSFIRNGTKKTELSIEHENISIKLTKPNNSYEVNGSIFPKVGIKVPDEILEFGIKEFETEAESINLIAPSQLDPLFMIAYSDQVNTRILNKIFNVQKYRLASAKAKKDNDNNTRDMKLLKDDISNNKAELSFEQSLLEKALEVKELMNLIDKIDELINLTSTVNTLSELITIKSDILNSINKLIFIQTYDTLVTSLYEISFKLDKMNIKRDIIEYHLSVYDINVIIDASNDLSNIEKLISCNITKTKILNTIEVMTNDIYKISDLIDYEDYHKSINDINNKISSIDFAIKLVSDIGNLKIEVEMIRNFINDSNSVNSIIDISSIIDIKLKNLQDEIKLIPVCKYCGNQLHN